MQKSSRSDLAGLAEKIRLLRETMNLSQGEFARAVGVRQQKVSDWERGHGLRQVVMAWRLADVLGRANVRAAPNRRGKTP